MLLAICNEYGLFLTMSNRCFRKLYFTYLYLVQCIIYNNFYLQKILGSQQNWAKSMEPHVPPGLYTHPFPHYQPHAPQWKIRYSQYTCISKSLSPKAHRLYVGSLLVSYSPRVLTSIWWCTLAIVISHGIGSLPPNPLCSTSPFRLPLSPW